LTCTEGIFLFLYWTHMLQYYTQYYDLSNRKGPLTWNGGFSYVVTKFPSLLVPCPQSTTSFKIPPWPQCLPSFPPLPANTNNTIHTDNINISKSSSVGHNISYGCSTPSSFCIIIRQL
jgi:hypothetical protein